MVTTGLRLSDDMTMQDAPPVIIGVDVGQKVDPTAICVAEAFRHDHPGKWEEWEFFARHLERIALGTDYNVVGKRLAEVITNIQARPVPFGIRAPVITMVVDATGVGTPVIDILRNELKRAGITVRVIEATFTHGDRLTVHKDAPRWTVGKAFLVSRLQALLQTDRIFLPSDHAEATAMAQELQDYEIRVNEKGNEQAGAFKVGTHDDLVTALGLAVLRDPRLPGRIVGV